MDEENPMLPSLANPKGPPEPPGMDDSVAECQEGYPSPSVAGDSIVDGSEHTFPKQSTYMKLKKGNKRSSLMLRKLPENILLKPSDEGSLAGSAIEDSLEDYLEEHYEHSSSLLQRACLNSKFSLRTQMMLSFGMVSSFSILIVMAVSLAAAVITGDRVSEITMTSFDDLARGTAGITAHYLADDLTARILPKDLVEIVVQATRDRFAGYPVFEDDSQVPFRTTVPNVNHYPLRGAPLPLDWQMNEDGGNVNSSNYYEHVQDRHPLYSHSPNLDTGSAAFYMQGMCDPAATDPSDSRYFPNCTDANNNISTGGVVAPTTTSAQIHRKASDLSPLLKSLYEYHQDVVAIGVYFGNSGAGNTVVFPHYELNYSKTYKSIGCSWMLNDNPVDPTRTFATLEEFERCELGGIHTEGNVISSRYYNPLDRAWCRDQAMNPGKVLAVGPMQAALVKGAWLMSIGKALYDRITKEFIACVAVEIVLDSVEDIIRSSKVTHNSEVSIVRYNDAATVVASTGWDRTLTNGTVVLEDLRLGVTQESYQRLYTLIDYKKPWDPDAVVQAYEEFHVHEEGFLIATYPIPPVPQKYDPEYLPEFLVVVSLAEDQGTKNIQGSVDDTAAQLVRSILIVGFVGLGAMVIIIFMVAGALTFPLTYMNTVASDIINSFGDNRAGEGEGIKVDRRILDSNCVPKTELDDIVKEFLKMVRNFSGSAMAESTRGRATEIENRFNLRAEFHELYQSRANSKFKYRFPNRKSLDEDNQEQEGDQGFRVNYGRSVSKDSPSSVAGSRSLASSNRIEFMLQKSGKQGMRSPLFFWIVVLIVTPLMFTTITMSCFVMVNISNSFPAYVDEAKEHFVKEELFALQIYVALRANLTAGTTERAIRNLHVVTRYMNWILNGGLNLTAGTTELVSSIEECKVYANISECPFMLAQNCACAWGDARSECSEYSEDSRNLQLAFHNGQSQDTERDGDRMNTSFPKVAYSQATTAWWDNMTTLPGYQNSFGVSRHESTHDRMRSASSLPLMQLLYNSDEVVQSTVLGIYVAYEDDGLFVGFKGCMDDHPANAGWQSTVKNGANDLRPELCPLGKYGYDPRCRNWYHKGREAKGVNQSSVYVTPPYEFAGVTEYAQSASSPLSDSKTGKHIGQMLVDFVSQPIFDSLNGKNFVLSGKGFPILITVDTDNFGADAVIGPGLSGEARPIADLVLPNDPECQGTACGHGFFGILKEMKAGYTGTSSFTRIGDDGSSEIIHISYTPVVVKTFSAVDSSDFSRGVFKSQFLLYSIAFAENEVAMLANFYKIEDEIHAQFYITLAVLCATIILSTLFVVYISRVITLSMTEPMVQLLDLICTINGLKDGEHRPEPVIDRNYGSWEVLNVTCTMERLYKVIRSANTAFFAGDVETAYTVLKDALKLFRRLGNKKAIGVACNNLGNTLLAAYRTMKATKEKRICGFKKKEIIAKGTACFHEAIQQGERAYDEFYEREGWSPNCLDFMQHLSNRYFNRAMFLLTVKDDHSKPDEIQELGARDLQISRDMDVEINDEGTQVGWNVRGIEKKYDVMLSRFKGHLSLIEMGYNDDFELEEWMREAFQLLKKELKTPDTSSLFFELGPAGRMQQIELELMTFYVLRKDIPTAARIGIRMLVEDEFTLSTAQLLAVKVLQKYAELEVSGIRNDVKGALAEYRRRVEVAVNEIDARSMDTLLSNTTGSEDGSETASMPFFGVAKCSEPFHDDVSTSVEMTERRKISLLHSSRGDITMEMF